MEVVMDDNVVRGDVDDNVGDGGRRSERRAHGRGGGHCGLDRLDKYDME
jgi:hypothetical protein